jgi:hypothetical protein
LQRATPRPVSVLRHVACCHAVLRRQAARHTSHGCSRAGHAPVVVVGGGAAGLTAAYFAAQGGAQVGSALSESRWWLSMIHATQHRPTRDSHLAVAAHTPAGVCAGAHAGGGKKGADVGRHALQRTAR